MPIVSNQSIERIIREQTEAENLGFSLTQPWYALGTKLIEWGQDNYRASREGFEKMPSADKALTEVANAINSEQREDIIINAHDINMWDNGMLHVPELGREFLLSEKSFEQMVRRIIPAQTPSPAGYWRTLSPERRYTQVNDALRHSQRNLKLRTRSLGAEPEVFAVVSPRYTAYDGDMLARRLNELLALEEDMPRAIVTYDNTRTAIDLIWHSDFDPTEVGVGEIYKSSIRYTTDDNGTERLRSFANLFRAICVNLTTVESTMAMLSRRHVGAADTIDARVTMSHGEAADIIRRFLTTWIARKNVDVREFSEIEIQSPAPLIATLFGTPSWRINGANPASIAEAAEEAWFSETPDWSIVGVSNALTKAAHRGMWSNSRIEHELQVAGGRLITAIPNRLPWRITAETVAV